MIVAAAASALLVLLVADSDRSPKPSYSGRKLSYWVERYVVPDQESGKIQYGEVDRAIRQIGTNGFPFLLKWVRYEPRPWKRKLCGAANSIIERVNPSWHFSIRDQDEIRAEGSVWAFKALSAEADAVIGELTILLNDPKARVAASRAVEILCRVDAGLPPLLSVLTNEQATPARKLTVLQTLGLVGHNAQNNGAALLDYARDAGWDDGMRSLATNLIRKFTPGALDTNWVRPLLVE